MNYAVCLTFLALTSMSCAGAEEPETSGRIGLATECLAPCKAPELDKRVFLLQSSQGFEPLAGSTVRLSFDGGRVRLFASCNSFEGEFEVRDDKLVLSEASLTDVSCEPEEHAEEGWLASFMTASPRIEVDADTLTLTGDNATLVFLEGEVADPDRPLVNTTWDIDSFITNDAVADFPAGSESSIWLTEDGTIRYLTGCGSGHASYTVSGNQLTLGPVGSGAIDCRAKPVAVEAEKHILRVLSGEGALTVDIEASRLTLKRGNVGLSALARQ